MNDKDFLCFSKFREIDQNIYFVLIPIVTLLNMVSRIVFFFGDIESK